LELFADQGAFKKIKTSVDLEAGLPTVYADRNQLQQVLINLFLNARDAMPNGGTMTVTARRGACTFVQAAAPNGVSTVRIGRRREDVNRAFRASLRDAGTELPCVRLEIHDTGEGVAPENLAKVFDPFFTTKEPGKGTGLGLAISARIIDTFGGRISLESTPGEGAAFILWLPLTGRKSER
jgi:signal transduction histidine kinase